MIDLGPHAMYIVAGYAGVVVVIAALVSWVSYSSRAVKARLEALDAQGVRRRSAAP